MRATKVIVACGAFTNGPSSLLPMARAGGLDLTLSTTQTVQFALSEADAARLAGMPSVIAKFDHFWAYARHALPAPPTLSDRARIVMERRSRAHRSRAAVPT